MRLQSWAWLLCAAMPLMAGCAGFWVSPTNSNTSFTLSNGGSITVSPGSSGTSTITVTSANSFSGTVNLTCAVSTSPTGASSPTTCTTSPTSVTISSTAGQSATLTATTTSSTTTGAYDITVTGTSGNISATTTVCADVSTTSATCSATAGASGVFYVANQTTDQIIAMSITTAGKLTTVGALTPPAPPLAIAVAPNGKFLYVSANSGIYLYTIGSNGALTLGNNSVAISSDPATTMQVDTTNSWLVNAVNGSSRLAAIAINATTGQLATSGETEQLLWGGLTATTPTQLVISPSDTGACANCYVFVAMGSGGTELVHFNSASSNPFGAAYHLNLANGSGGASTVAVDPANQLMYVGETEALPSATQSGGLRALTIGSGGATEVPGSPYATGGVGPSSILPTTNGSYVYVANRSVSGISTGNITGFSVSTASLTSIGTVAAGPTGLLSMAEDSTGSYLLVVDAAGNPDLEAYTISSGTLTSPLTGAAGNNSGGAGAIAALP